MSNTSLSTTEQNAQILMVRILMDQSIDKILAEFMSMNPEKIGEEIFRLLTEMVEQGKSKFNEYVVKRRASPPLMIEGREAEYETMLSQWQKSSIPQLMEAMITPETTSVKMSSIWWFAAWVDKSVTLLLLEETELRINALRLFWRLKQIEIEKTIPVTFGVLAGTTAFYANTTLFIPDEVPPKWLYSLYAEYYKVKKYKLPEISTPEDLFISVADMDKAIKALRLIRPDNPIIDENRRWLVGKRGFVKVLSAWIYWLDYSQMIHNIDSEELIPLLEDLFPGLKLGRGGRTFNERFPKIFDEFKNLKLS